MHAALDRSVKAVMLETALRFDVTTLAVCVYLEHCLANDVRPIWGCYYNVASENLAQKMVFTNKREVEVAYVHVVEDKRRPRQRA